MLLALIFANSQPVFEDERRLMVHAGRDRWDFRCQVLKSGILSDEGRYRTVSVTQNGRYVHAPTEPADAWLPSGNFFQFSRLRVKGGDPVVAIRGHYGLGMHWDTVFYRIHLGRLQVMGRPPAINSNGPVNWKGRPDRWVFDNYDSYAKRDDPEWRLEWHLYRIDLRTGKLRFVRKWRAPDSQRVRDTVLLNDW